jgi:O-antigen/teichoic acid export membrane protein
VRTISRLLGLSLLLAVPAALVVGALGSAERWMALGELGPACPFLAITGIVCPFCGMTRATLLLGAGEIRAALALHPLAPAVLALTLWAALGLVRPAPPGKRGLAPGPRTVLVATALIWLVNLGNQLLRP